MQNTQNGNNTDMYIDFRQQETYDCVLFISGHVVIGTIHNPNFYDAGDCVH